MLCLQDFEEQAAKKLPLATWSFYSLGAEREDTKKDNQDAFRSSLVHSVIAYGWEMSAKLNPIKDEILTFLKNLRDDYEELWYLAILFPGDPDIASNINAPVEVGFLRYKFLPRMLRNEDEIRVSTTVLGEKISFPVGFAPSACQRMAHPDGELAAVKAAAAMDTVYTLSTVSNTSLEDVAEATPNALRWMQVYILEDRQMTVEMIQRVEKCGYKALVLTVDTPAVGLHFKAWKTGFSVSPHLKVPHIPAELRDNMRKMTHLQEEFKPVLLEKITWKDVSWLKSISRLPIVLKGILTAEDAKLAVEYGASAVWVSNHGGRQLDGTLATIDALQPIAQALEGSGCEVYVDGGVRWGSDVLKALALGAKAVFIGRPLLWGLSCSGEEGAREVLRILKKELILAMKLSGCQNLSEIGPSLLHKPPYLIM